MLQCFAYQRTKFILIWPAWWWGIYSTSVAVFWAVDDFLRSCNRFWQHPCDLVHHLWDIGAFRLYFLFMPICCNHIYIMCLMRRPPFQMLCLILLMSSWNAVLNASNAVSSFLHFRLVFSFIALLYFESSTWRDKIAPVRPPPVAKLSLNKLIFMKFEKLWSLVLLKHFVSMKW